MTEPEFVECLIEDLAKKRSLMSTYQLIKLQGELRGIPADANLKSAIKRLRKMIADNERLIERMSRYKLASGDTPDVLSGGPSDV